ncbi:hypothetical protein AQUCO_01300265v1 [Aquilegia coerulea]|uniref:Uncharacterized protein n=1 Tax=Aquilegia coerulea TaxID=218851 RepID=A0A2G5E0M5_AQUCA|nr:hypothetical protein AQUCO_01300265v1 [Aquilegia coerulea]
MMHSNLLVPWFCFTSLGKTVTNRDLKVKHVVFSPLVISTGGSCCICVLHSFICSAFASSFFHAVDQTL